MFILYQFHIINIFSSLLLGFAACTSLYSTWCYWGCRCSLFMEWGTKAGMS